MIDIHNHSESSIDAEYTVHDMVQSAIHKGITVFAITDHCDIDDYEKNNLAVSVAKSVQEIQRAKASLPMKLLTGIELGQPLQDVHKSQEILDCYDFDYVIGSIHVVGGEQDFYWMDYNAMTDYEIDVVLEKYYKEVYELVKWNKFDSLAHISYPYRYIINANLKRDIKCVADKFDEMATELFKLLIKNGKALENNSSSLRKSKDDYALNYKYMKLYFDLGGELVTTGSDAHTPEMVGNGILQGYAMLKEIGFKCVTYFEKRKPIQVSI